MTQTIPCTVQIVTRNNVEGMKKCLPQLTMFDEVIVQDGYSTDGTREVAESFPNVRIMDQNRQFLNAEGRIIDFSAMRNESIFAAKNEWVFIIDADEFIRPELIAEIGEIVAANKPGVYEVFRRFYIDGEAVMFCSGYPASQIRMFHRSIIKGYTKTVHERLMLKEGVRVQKMKGELPIPMPPVSALAGKYDRYIQMEVRRVGIMPWKEWTRWILLRNIRSMLGQAVRVLWLRLLPKRGKRMPFSHEYAQFRHSFRTILHTFPPRVRRTLRAEQGVVK